MEEAGDRGLEGGLEEQRKPLTNSPEALAWGAELQLAGKSGRPVTWSCQGRKVYVKLNPLLHYLLCGSTAELLVTGLGVIGQQSQPSGKTKGWGEEGGQAGTLWCLYIYLPSYVTTMTFRE